MAPIMLNAYDADVLIPGFSGIFQQGDGLNADAGTARSAINMATLGGVLQPCGACKLLDPSVPSPIETLACLHRRWYSEDDDRDILIAAAGGMLYAMPIGGTAWQALPMPEGVEAFACNVWSCLSYEINPEGSYAPVDVLIMSNAQDGMICVRGDTMTIELVPTPKTFGVIARYAERIWGGAIQDDPDTLVFSAPFDPRGWEANLDIPEDGAGDVMQPSWDGDGFLALVQMGTQLIAFKRNRIWRILGTDPGEYAFREQYGSGTKYVNTIALDGERILMLTDEGVMQYDGVSTSLLMPDACKTIYDTMHKAALDQACGCVFKNVYYCAFPVNGESCNNAVLMLNLKDGTWLYRDDLSVEAFLPTFDRLFFTSHSTPGRVYEWGQDSWTAGTAAHPAWWYGQWQDLQQKAIRKGGFEVYLTVEAQDAVPLTIGIETERSLKMKTVTFDKSEPDKARQRRIRFGGSGRRFRLIIGSETSVAWRIVGGVLVKAEMDPE